MSLNFETVIPVMSVRARTLFDVLDKDKKKNKQKRECASTKNARIALVPMRGPHKVSGKREKRRGKDTLFVGVAEVWPHTMKCI